MVQEPFDLYGYQYIGHVEAWSDPENRRVVLSCPAKGDEWFPVNERKDRTIEYRCSHGTTRVTARWPLDRIDAQFLNINYLSN